MTKRGTGPGLKMRVEVENIGSQEVTKDFSLETRDPFSLTTRVYTVVTGWIHMDGSLYYISSNPQAFSSQARSN